MNAVANTWAGATATTAYDESFSYDANGNIINLNRKDQAGTDLDKLSYNYENTATGFGKNTNKLRAVTELAGLTADPGDIENQVFDLNNHNNDNYEYDNIGNLIKDKNEQIANISWTVYGKIASITREAGSSKANLEFKYDASGNRILKKAINPSSGEIKSTFYVRDATGNLMAVYEKTEVANTKALSLAEQHIYGSSRLGVKTPGLVVETSLIPPSDQERNLGQKTFELSNHLGNVLAVVTDAKTAVDDGTYLNGVKQNSTADNSIDFFAANVVSATDYYAYGSPMPGRQFNSNSYRYGFNGQEKDNEINVDGGDYDFGARIYDSRIGRWLSLDPQTSRGPGFSPYNYSFNSPVLYADPDGEWAKVTTKKFYLAADGKTLIEKTSFRDIFRKTVKIEKTITIQCRLVKL